MTRRWLAALGCAAAISAPVVVTPTAVASAGAAVFYAPGTRDSPSAQATVDMADIGMAVMSFGTQAVQIGYPASLLPFQGAIALNLSVAAGQASLEALISAVPVGIQIILIGVSQGDIVLSLVEKALIASGSTRDVLFVRLADPTGATGVMGRNVGLSLPGLLFVGRPEESPFDQVVITHEYDAVGHWPAQQLNGLAVVNAILGAIAFHNPASYAVDLSAIPTADITTTVNSLGATTTTYLIRATGLLPILLPLQALGVDEHVLNRLQRALKPMIDSAYTPLAAPMLAVAAQGAFQSAVNGMSSAAANLGSQIRRVEAAITAMSNALDRAAGKRRGISASATSDAGLVGASETGSTEEPPVAEPDATTGQQGAAATGSEDLGSMTSADGGEDDSASSVDSAPLGQGWQKTARQSAHAFGSLGPRSTVLAARTSTPRSIPRENDGDAEADGTPASGTASDGTAPPPRGVSSGGDRATPSGEPAA